jgi:hypothetical protein
MSLQTKRYIANTRSDPLTLDVWQRSLPPLRISHLVNLNVVAHGHVAHGLWSNKDELTTGSIAGCLDHHPHTDISVDAVHEHVAAGALVTVAHIMYDAPTTHPGIG